MYVRTYVCLSIWDNKKIKPPTLRLKAQVLYLMELNG